MPMGCARSLLGEMVENDRRIAGNPLFEMVNTPGRQLDAGLALFMEALNGFTPRPHRFSDNHDAISRRNPPRFASDWRSARSESRDVS